MKYIHLKVEDIIKSFKECHNMTVETELSVRNDPLLDGEIYKIIRFYYNGYKVFFGYTKDDGKTITWYLPKSDSLIKDQIYATVKSIGGEELVNKIY